jgi:hypothetical protein
LQGICVPYLTDGVSVAPWGIYRAQDFDDVSVLREARGYLSKNANTTSTITKSYSPGYGAFQSVHAINGDTTSTVVWPESFTPTSFTMCSISRYTGTTIDVKNRIITSAGCTPQCNFVHGHYSHNRGVAYYNGFKTLTRSIWKSERNTAEHNS